MKKIALSITLIFLLSVGCGKDEITDNSSANSGSCGSHNGKPLNKGPEGGCYYINSKGNKTYVDRSECKC